MPSPRCADCALTPINLHDTTEYAELKRQRHLCGWNHDDEVLLRWRSEIEAKTKNLFWVDILTPDPNSVTGPQSWHRRIGHASLDSAAHPADPTIARADKTLLTISTFFILPAYRSTGAGRAVMDLLESMATREPYGSPRCEAIALHTLSRRYYDVDGPEGRGIFEFLQDEGGPGERGRSNEDWYVRRGYVRWKEEERYPYVRKDGTPGRFVAAFLRKELR